MSVVITRVSRQSDIPRRENAAAHENGADGQAGLHVIVRNRSRRAGTVGGLAVEDGTQPGKDDAGREGEDWF